MLTNSSFLEAVRTVDGLTAGLDGYSFILKSLELRLGDPSIELPPR